MRFLLSGVVTAVLLAVSVSSDSVGVPVTITADDPNRIGWCSGPTADGSGVSCFEWLHGNMDFSGDGRFSDQPDGGVITNLRIVKGDGNTQACTLMGASDGGGTAGFFISPDAPDYLSHCGSLHGYTIVCDGDGAADCDDRW